MGVSIFALTANSVRAHMFPQANDYSVNSSPTAAIVAEFIEEEAGELAGKLYAENIVASDIAATLDANNLHSAAWLWCVRTLRLMVAIRCLNAGTQADPEVAKAYRAELAKRLKDLDERGATALGDTGLNTGASDPDGPTSHISRNNLTIDASEDMSDTIPALRKSDRL